MQITRGVRPERDFAIISNCVLRDSALSYRARGVLCCILSYTEGYQISSDRLAEMGREGRDAIRSALSELETAGYLKRLKVQDEKGLWSSSAVINDVPDLSARKLPVPAPALASGELEQAPAPEKAPEAAPVEPETGFQSPVNRRLKNRQSVFQALKEDQEEDKKKKEAPAPAVPKISFDGQKFQDLTDQQVAVWAAAYPAVSVTAEILKAEAWLDANPANRKSDYKRFLNNWLCRAQDKAPPVRVAATVVQAKPRYASAQTTADRRAATLSGLTGQDNNNTQGQDHARTIDIQSRFV